MDAIRTLIPLALLLIVCDLPWLYATGNWTQSMFKKIQGGAPMVVRLQAAPPVYLALAYLVTQASSTMNAFLIGLSTYTVYEFTNYAALTNYDPQFAIADSLWGGVLFTIVRTVAIKLNIL
jgi:uncharacterized membrane protein